MSNTVEGIMVQPNVNQNPVACDNPFLPGEETPLVTDEIPVSSPQLCFSVVAILCVNTKLSSVSRKQQMLWRR